ncbi:MAG: hypothetical protein ETSY1_07590 [Candidatus Entotheonella factor]|uniref:Uncharacterized protein n=1 Tax=Entotheonella factor TaxID=1429438 RepID=W4LU57_ENTF1|nr:hypothetical protein [Candidatus Entotheonella palauensis]ETX01390.1 MAG: hypothetical protein ETSY1_07590 [Candidatus Entotheonella factor]
MVMTIEAMTQHIRDHRCYTHPIFQHWADSNPEPEVIGALFHQIQSFCAATRPGGNFPEALQSLGLSGESSLLQEIVESEEDHGPQLATMAGFILNQAAGENVCSDLYSQVAVEDKLKEFSDSLLGSLPGYHPESGLTTQARKAIQVFDKRELTDHDSTFNNLGTALALEMISNRQLIPGEKHCLVDSGLYGANMDQPEMYYLAEHWGEVGAEQQHEKNAIEAVASVLNGDTAPLILEGANHFLNSLANLWDVLDAALLQSGDHDKSKAKVA